MKTLRYKGGSTRIISSDDMQRAYGVKSDDIVADQYKRFFNVSNKVADTLLKNMPEEFELSSEIFGGDIEEEVDSEEISEDEAAVRASGGHPIPTDQATAKQAEG